ncbi:MAG TPA: hypothetical protein VLA37_10635 [Sphingomonadaceae bacterium]|nr:hypothetical protein [Sphingomonadaceae bacterium]
MTPTPAPAQPEAEQLPVETEVEPVEIQSVPPAAAVPVEADPVQSNEPSGRVRSLSWWWLSVPLLLVLIALVAIAVHVRQRRKQVPEIVVPQVVKPQVRPSEAPQAAEQAPQPPPRPSPTPATIANTPEGPLSIGIEARYLSISLTAATLSYRLTITNSAKTSLRDVVISGDMISAHSSISEADQIATETVELEQRHVIDRLPARESVQVSGEFRLPFTRIRPIRKGDAALFVPLARLRANAGEAGTIVQTALVGQRSTRPGARLQPFRLDLGPRVYREVTQRIFS